MNKYDKYIDTFFIITGTTYSLDNIETLLGIIILSLQLLWLCVKAILKICKCIKEKKDFVEIDNEINDVINKLDEVKDQLKEKEGEENVNRSEE